MVIAGLIVTLCVAAVVLGGLKRIASVAQIIVPFMAVIYILFGLSVILLNAVQIPAALLTIVRAAFSPAAVTGGVVGSVTIAMQKGIAAAYSQMRRASVRPDRGGRRPDQRARAAGSRIDDRHLY